MTILAIGTCAVIAVAAQTGWRSPKFLRPLLKLGQRSYEVYLTHMFLVFALFEVFTAIGKPMLAVPVLFFSVVLFSGLLGEVVAVLYSERMNRFLRERWREGPNRLGAAVIPLEPSEARGRPWLC
jgi:peptidoglycan/LPS O-acetylase OafA/YrhL